jgi:hypothetical protein
MDIDFDILNHLKRHFIIVSYRLALGDKNTKVKFVVIDGNTVPLHLNKKYLVNRIFEVIDKTFYLSSVGVKRKTIKYYIDTMRLQNIDTNNNI